MGEPGQDGPVIATLGEYDALPGLRPRQASRRTGLAWQLSAFLKELVKATDRALAAE